MKTEYEKFSEAFDDARKRGSQLLSYGRSGEEYRNRFDRCSYKEQLEGIMFNYDYRFISTLLQDWQKKAKTESQKKTLDEAVKSVTRMGMHYIRLDFAVKSALTDGLFKDDMLRFFEEKIKEICNQNDALKKEVEYYTENYEPKK
jgi:hypothetical protein